MFLIFFRKKCENNERIRLTEMSLGGTIKTYRKNGKNFLNKLLTKEKYNDILQFLSLKKHHKMQKKLFKKVVDKAKRE